MSQTDYCKVHAVSLPRLRSEERHSATLPKRRDSLWATKQSVMNGTDHLTPRQRPNKCEGYLGYAKENVIAGLP